MPPFGKVAVKAVQNYRSHRFPSPMGAWDAAIRDICTIDSIEEKICSRSVFLGLCEAGMVRGIPGGTYLKTKPGEKSPNKIFATSAAQLIAGEPGLVRNKSRLRELLTDSGRNAQIDVVIALWESGLIEIPASCMLTPSAN